MGGACWGGSTYARTAGTASGGMGTVLMTPSQRHERELDMRITWQLGPFVHVVLDGSSLKAQLGTRAVNVTLGLDPTRDQSQAILGGLLPQLPAPAGAIHADELVAFTTIPTYELPVVDRDLAALPELPDLPLLATELATAWLGAGRLLDAITQVACSASAEVAALNERVVQQRAAVTWEQRRGESLGEDSSPEPGAYPLDAFFAASGCPAVCIRPQPPEVCVAVFCDPVGVLPDTREYALVLGQTRARRLRRSERAYYYRQLVYGTVVGTARAVFSSNPGIDSVVIAAVVPAATTASVLLVARFTRSELASVVWEHADADAIIASCAQVQVQLENGMPTALTDDLDPSVAEMLLEVGIGPVV